MRTSYDAPAGKRAPHWGDRAACTKSDPDAFFPISYVGVGMDEVQAAKAVCARCPVVGDCLTYAIERPEPEGVWGGLDPDERRELAGAREAPRAPA